jgi:hypothetical protein
MVYRIAGWDALAFLEGPFHDAAASRAHGELIAELP